MYPLVDDDTSPVTSEYADDPDMAELVAEFVESLHNHARVLHEAAAAGDRARICGLSHQIKGAAGGYGFGMITTAAADLEQALRAPEDAPDTQQRFSALVQLCERAAVA